MSTSTKTSQNKSNARKNLKVLLYFMTRGTVKYRGAIYGANFVLTFSFQKTPPHPACMIRHCSLRGDLPCNKSKILIRIDFKKSHNVSDLRFHDISRLWLNSRQFFTCFTASANWLKTTSPWHNNRYANVKKITEYDCIHGNIIFMFFLSFSSISKIRSNSENDPKLEINVLQHKFQSVLSVFDQFLGFCFLPLLKI